MELKRTAAALVAFVIAGLSTAAVPAPAAASGASQPSANDAPAAPAAAAAAPAQIALAKGSVATRSSMITYKSGPDDVKAYMAAPKEGGPFPALIVIHEWWGLNDQIKGVADVWASRGYVAVAPDLYRGKVTADPKVAMELLNALPESRATSDLVALFSFLRANAAVKSMPVASIGFCMGGRLSLLLATAEPNLAACVVCYGRPETDQAKLAKIQAPVLGIYGGADKGIPQESLDGLTQQMNGLKKSIQIKVFPTAGHGFLNQNNPAYNAETAKEAWSVIEPFVSKALSPRSK